MNYRHSWIIIFLLFISSCQNEENAVDKDIAFIRKETGMNLTGIAVKLGERTENYDADYLRTIVYQIPIEKVDAFVKQIDLKSNPSSELGHWEKDERHVCFRPESNVKNKSCFVTLDYTYESQVLVVCINQL
jgi:hypothetical protein